jgi:Trypsin-co-occurring domain 2
MIELASVIRDLREELERAVAAAEGAALRFELETVELEVTVAVERSGEAGARARFWVLEANAGGAAAATSTQRLTLALRPTLRGAGGPPFVRGAAEPYER